jgi:hypothetical protein
LTFDLLLLVYSRMRVVLSKHPGLLLPTWHQFPGNRPDRYLVSLGSTSPGEVLQLYIDGLAFPLKAQIKGTPFGGDSRKSDHRLRSLI